jgi:hypothetical protein
MSRSPIPALRAIGVLIAAMVLGSCNSLVKVHYPKLNWKSGSHSEVQIWNESLGTSLRWETRMATVSTSSLGTPIGPRCAIAKVGRSELAGLVKQFSILREVKFDFEAKSYGKFQECFNFSVHGKFPDVCGSAKIMKNLAPGRPPSDSILTGPKLYSCVTAEKSYLVAYDRFFFPDTR